MRSVPLRAMTFILFIFAFAAADEPATKSPREQFEGIVKTHRDAQNEYSRAYQAAKTKKEREHASKELGSRAYAGNYTSDLLSLIKQNPNDEVAIDVLKWLFRYEPSGAASNTAIDRIGDGLLKSKRMIEFCDLLDHYSGPAGEKLLNNLIAVNPHRSVQGNARFSQIMSLKEEIDESSEDPTFVKEAIQKVEEMVKVVIDQYGDVEHFPSTLKEAADGVLFELKSLSIGCVAPEIVGEDLDGRPLKLSDFRGKVVLLDFWGTWCGPCMAELPDHQKRLERYSGKPFAVVGIDKDDDRENVKKVLAERGISWQSWWDGKEAPIAVRWNIRGWPTLYLIDAKGVIRYKGDILRSSSARKNAKGEFESFRFVDDYIELLVQEAAAGE